MAEVEPPDGISARKLVLETGKFNVLTAYSAKEAVQLLREFPRVDAIIIHSSLAETARRDLMKSLKKASGRAVMILLTASEGQHSHEADYHVSSHEPQQLLQILIDLFGDPRHYAA